MGVAHFGLNLALPDIALTDVFLTILAAVIAAGLYVLHTTKRTLSSEQELPSWFYLVCASMWGFLAALNVLMGLLTLFIDTAGPTG
jgi:hypothetical protein